MPRGPDRQRTDVTSGPRAMVPPGLEHQREQRRPQETPLASPPPASAAASQRHPRLPPSPTGRRRPPGGHLAAAPSPTVAPWSPAAREVVRTSAPRRLHSLTPTRRRAPHHRAVPPLETGWLFGGHGVTRNKDRNPQARLRMGQEMGGPRKSAQGRMQPLTPAVALGAGSPFLLLTLL